MSSEPAPPLAASRALPTPVSMAVCVHSAPGAYALLLGSGISSAAGISTGWGIMQDLAHQAAALLGQEEEQLTLAKKDPDIWWARHFPEHGDLTYSKLLGELGPEPGARQQLLRKYFDVREPTRAHHAIADLVRDGYLRVILTTNFDPLMEDALQAAGVPFQMVTSDQTSAMQPIAHGGTPTVVKLHGDFRQLDMRNTTDELDTYPAAWAQLVREVFRDFGLIVCGWSGDWDRALVECLSQRESHRFPVFWSAFHTPQGPAAELVAQLGADVIADTSADGLFTGLAKDVEALQRMADIPPTRDMALNRLKQCLPDPTRRIDLHDLIDQHVEQTVERVHDHDRHPALQGTPMTLEAYVEQLGAYREDSETLLYLLATGVFHDRQAEHVHVWVRALQRLVDARDRLDGHPMATAEHFPALLALHAAGCAAVLTGREDILARLLTGVTWKTPFEESARPVATAVRAFDVLGDGRFLAAPSGALSNRSRQSSRLRGDLRGVLAEACAHSDRAFGAAFDRLEYLMLLVQLDLSVRWINTAPTFLARAVFNDDRVEEHGKVAALVAQDLRPGWTMLSGGAFSGDLERAKAAAAKLASEITQVQ